MDIHTHLTHYNHNKGTTDRILGIVIHYVGALGSARDNCIYFAGASRGASAHYYVDFDGSVWQSVEDKNIAWHCGAERGVSYKHPYLRNSNTIGIEMCVRNDSKDKTAESYGWYFEDATVQGTIELVLELMSAYNIKSENVVRHFDITGKYCPNPYVYNHTKHVWKDFKESLEWVDVTKQYADGTFLTLLSAQNNRYACVDLGSPDDAPVYANKTTASTWETFQITATEDNWVALKSVANNKYLSARLNPDLGSAPLHANVDHLRTWECFRIYRQAGFSYIQSMANNCYLTVMIDLPEAPVHAQAPEPFVAERFLVSEPVETKINA
ncbi:MAG: N-acetylmuramoyl-L-alanine amidase [Peptococcaceae bacterium]|nr:N-acetylmuramoyl-L-alanine amidase [Peptococcaceae bacterium]